MTESSAIRQSFFFVLPLVLAHINNPLKGSFKNTSIGGITMFKKIRFILAIAAFLSSATIVVAQETTTTTKTEEHHTGVKRTYNKAKHKVKHAWNKAKTTTKTEYNKAKTRIKTDDANRDMQEKK